VPNWGDFAGFFFLVSEIVASSVQGVPYPTAEAVAAAAPVVAEGKAKGKGGGVSPEKGSSAAPSGDDASRRYHSPSPSPWLLCSCISIWFHLGFNYILLCSCDSGSDDSSDTRDYDTDHKVPGNLL
jgi:plant G-box-binding factor